MSAYPAGARVLEKLTRGLGGTLGVPLAQALWAQVSEHLLAHDFPETVEAALQSSRGGLDTLERGDVLDAWGLVTVGRRWPLNGDSEEDAGEFLEALGTHLRERGALKLPEGIAA